MTDPVATGFMAPFHGRGAVGFFLLGLFSTLTVIVGGASANLPLTLFGLAGLFAAAGGFAWYWVAMSKQPLAIVYADRLEVRRGPQRGMLPFAAVTQVRMLQWNRSFFPYSRGHRLLVLRSGEVDWQIGPEIANYAALQDAVSAALEAFHAASVTSPLVSVPLPDSPPP